MQLNISELDDDDLKINGLFSQMPLQYEQIPENSAPIKVVKTVSFQENTGSGFMQKRIYQPMPKENTGIIKEQVQTVRTTKISYDDILSKMGMLVSDGKLHLIDKNTLSTQQQQILNITNKQTIKPSQYVDNTNINENSYIYNKYFKNETQQTHNNVKKPTSFHEYKMMLIDDYLQQYRIKQIKSNKLIMPTSNINISQENMFSGNLNKLFGFSKR